MAAFLHFGEALSTQPMQAPEPSASISAPTPRAKPTASVVSMPPPPGLARGDHEVSGWLVGAAALVLVGFVVAFFVIRHRRAMKRRVYESVAPQSGPMSSRR